ncbi:MAG: peptide chain release factor N(5)-glutamine methyltransferase [Rickettsiales bacterium]|jgi:release factor glutamine methyltransferase|nr:peptide chain release factor N(5)-glutamine methyltransferase [Rickettsiales bacterium]
MANNQVFRFLKKFASPHDVKMIMNNTGMNNYSIFRIWRTAWQLRRKVPIAKIIHRKWFYGLSFYTNRHTLDPRPDSETLVDAVLKNESGAKTILDLGTGTGCLLCAILKNLPNATGVGIDKSRHACGIARRNAKNLGLNDRIKIIHLSFAKCRGSFMNDFDIVIANPPYIPNNDPRVDSGAKHDPKMALFGGADGLKYYREIALLKTNAKLYIEIGIGQENGVKKIFREYGWNLISRFKDLSGRIRVLSFESSEFFVKKNRY